MLCGVLLSHEKELIWVSSDEVDEPRAYYTDWSWSIWGGKESDTTEWLNWTELKKKI